MFSISTVAASRCSGSSRLQWLLQQPTMSLCEGQCDPRHTIKGYSYSIGHKIAGRRSSGKCPIPLSPSYVSASGTALSSPRATLRTPFRCSINTLSPSTCLGFPSVGRRMEVCSPTFHPIVDADSLLQQIKCPYCTLEVRPHDLRSHLYSAHTPERYAQAFTPPSSWLPSALTSSTKGTSAHGRHVSSCGARGPQ